MKKIHFLLPLIKLLAAWARPAVRAQATRAPPGSLIDAPHAVAYAPLNLNIYRITNRYQGVWVGEGA